MSVQVSSVQSPAVAPPVAELYSGIDAFYFSGVGSVPSSVAEVLPGLRQQAEATRIPQLVEVGGQAFYVQPFGWRQYTYLLTHQFGRIGITESDRFPAYRVQPEAVALHGLGARQAVEWFQSVILSISPDTKFSASRVDLFCDLSGWAPGVEMRDRMINRSRYTSTYQDDDVLTGFTFGRRKTAGVMLRVYDKKREAVSRGHDYWFALWGDSYNLALPVWRVEFEVGRKALVQYGMNSTDDVFDRVGGVWAAISSNLYRLALPTGDNTRSRWPTDPVWEIIQHASLRSDAVPVERLVEAKRQGSLRRLEGPLTGVLSSVGALSGTSDIDETLDVAYDMVRSYESWSSRSFEERVEEKRRR